ncbi:hypothetical protein PMZ80_004166 [Knufia obscura]|uniref:Rhodopsin domain-containing protein n=1 Tax=Knufia obscura TaxID=1635080 RepID=A0ABR0RSE2_9EURO|nr:hypothetical protein PMZ80_004166 [Knufia obscura]
MGWDDWLAIAATFFSVAQFAIVLAAVPHLLGASYDQYSEPDAATVAELLRASEVFLLISLFVTKCAVLWLGRRLFSINQKTSRMVCEGAMVLSGLWCLASILAVTISCDSQAAIGLGDGTCFGLVKRWTVVGILDALLECLIIALSFVVVWPLRMSVARRLPAMACFLFRLPIIIFIGLHLHYLAVFINADNKGVALTKPIIFRQAELLFSLFSASIPALNQYLRKFSTTSAATFGYAPGAHSEAYGLKSMTRRTKNNNSQYDTLTGRDFALENQGNYKATVDFMNTKEPADSSADGQSLGRHNSDDMIIRKDVQYKVTYSE